MNKNYGSSLYPVSNKLPSSPKRNPWKTLLKVCCWTVGSLILLVAILIVGLNLYLTPQRVTKLVNEEASKYLDADVTAYNVSWKFFSTFPLLELHLDSLAVVSHSLKSLDSEQLALLPSDPDFLASTGEISLAINIKKLLKKKITLSKIEVAHPKVNIVMVSDSLSNFDIFPPIKKPEEMPDVKFSEIKIGAPADISFFSLPSQLAAKIDIEDFIFGIHTGNKKFYHLSLDSKLSVRQADITFADNLPINLSGDFSFDLLKGIYTLRDFTLSTSGLETRLATSLKVKHEKAIVENFDFKLNIDDCFSLLSTVPQEIWDKVTDVQDITGRVPMNVDISLISPWQIQIPYKFDGNIESLPPLTFNLSIPEADITAGKLMGKPIAINELTLEADALLDGREPSESYLHIPVLDFIADFTKTQLSASIDRLLSPEPAIDIEMLFSTPAGKSLSPFLTAEGLQLKGDIEGKMWLSLTVADIKDRLLKDIDINFKAGSKDLTVTQAAQKLLLGINNLDVTASAVLPSLSLSSSVTPQLSDLSMLTSFTKGLISQGDSLKIKLGNTRLEIEGDIMSKGGNSVPDANITFIGENLAVTDGPQYLELQDIETVIRGRLLTIPLSPTSDFVAVPASEEESIILARESHTPLYLSPSLQGMMSMAFTMTDIDADLKIKKGLFATPDYLLPVSFSDIILATDLDNITVKSLSASAGNSSLWLHGEVNGLRNFLVAAPSLLKVNFDAGFTDVDINQLSGAYYGAVEKLTGKPYDFTMPPQGPYTKADSICVAMPRNLDVVFRLHSDRAEYMDYAFSPLSTEILLKNGDATLHNLNIGAPYAGVNVDWTYSTRDLANIYMDIAADVDDFNFNRFFKAFPALVDSAPEITDLSGDVSSTFSGHFLMFPSMFLDVPSLTGKFGINASNLLFARKGKIEKITHLMRIEGSEPIHIDNIGINGTFHDNLLMLDPFKIKFDDYQLGIAGVNNLNGEMYYHLALEKSPFHLPFAVNLVGNFHHPEVRFGGTEVKDGRERTISADLGSNVDVNIMTYLSRGWKMFIETAAKFYLQNKEQTEEVSNSAE